MLSGRLSQLLKDIQLTYLNISKMKSTLTDDDIICIFEIKSLQHLIISLCFDANFENAICDQGQSKLSILEIEYTEIMCDRKNLLIMKQFIKKLHHLKYLDVFGFENIRHELSQIGDEDLIKELIDMEIESIIIKAPFYSSFPSHHLLELMKIQNYKWFNLGDERWAFSREDYLLTVLDELGDASLTSILPGIT